MSAAPTVVVAASVEVAADAAAVWRAATDWAGQARWMPFTTVEVVAGEGTSTGTRLVARTGIGPVAVVDPMTVVLAEPPLRCEVDHHGRVVRGRGVFVVAPLGPDKARFTWEERLPGSGLFGAVARVTRPVNRLFLALALRRFAGWVERERS